MSSTTKHSSLPCLIQETHMEWTSVPHGARPLRKEVLPQRDAPGRAVSRSMSSENQVQVGQDGVTRRICSSSSLTLHSVCGRRLTGETHNRVKPKTSCVPVHSCRWGPRSGSHTSVHGRTHGRKPGLTELP